MGKRKITPEEKEEGVEAYLQGKLGLNKAAKSMAYQGNPFLYG